VYTKCPECHVVFRVTAKILQQAHGKVRCGNCNVPFNALSFLSEELPPPGEKSDPDHFAETNRRLLETLNELAGTSDVRIEDTGVEWRVLDGDEELAEEDLQGDLRFDDNTRLPDDFVVEAKEEYDSPAPRRHSEFDSRQGGELDASEADLALSDPEDWTDLLDEFRDPDPDLLEVEEELAAIHTQLSSRDTAGSRNGEPGAADEETPMAPAADDDAHDLEGSADDIDFELTAEGETSVQSDLDLELTESESEVDVVLSDEESEPDVMLDAEASEPDLVLTEAASETNAAMGEFERRSDSDFEPGGATPTDDDTETDDSPDLQDVAEVDDEPLPEAVDEIVEVQPLEADEDFDDEVDEEPVLEAVDESDDRLLLEEVDEQPEHLDAPAEGSPPGETGAELEPLPGYNEALDFEAEAGDAPVLTLQADSTETPEPEPEKENPDLYVPPPSEEEMTVNMEIDQELLAAAASQENVAFSATLVGVERPEEIFEKNPEEVETIIMEGDFIRTAMDEVRPVVDQSTTDAFAEGADLADTYALSRKRIGGRRWNFEKPGLGASLLALLLAVGLGAQYVHYSRESLATMGFFKQTIAPVYRMLGMPVTPSWDIGGWQFEATNGSVNEDETVLTIVTRIGNRSEQPLPYPLIHVSLTDRFEDVMGSRILEPVEYLAGEGDPSRPVRPGNNFTAIINIQEPSVEATGFKLNVCYRVTQDSVRCAIEDFKN
jgi:predicted Zn finger-like uncharacterized protein